MTEPETRTIPFPEIPRRTVTVCLWAERGRPQLEALRGHLAAAGYQVLRWDSNPHQAYLAHAHIYDELLWLVEGSLTVILPAERRLLELMPGDRVDMPAGTLHAIQAGPEGATYLVATR